MLGCARLNRQDNTPPRAVRLCEEFKGINYIKDAYLKLAYYYLLQNDEAKFNYYINEVKTRGNATDEKDQQRYGKPTMPNRTWIYWRPAFILTGLLQQSLSQLAGKDAHFKLLRDKIQFYYYLDGYMIKPIKLPMR